MKHLILAGALVGLAACSPAQQQQANTTLDKASTAITQADAEIVRAETIWGIAKGMAIVAEVASPANATAIAALIASTDAKVAQLDALRAAVVPDAQALIVAAKAVQSDAVSLQNGTAKNITVVPNKA